VFTKCKISQQLENCENRNDPDLVQAFLKKWWVESDDIGGMPMREFYRTLAKVFIQINEKFEMKFSLIV
jgi:hypothetical protein